jgi:methionine-rich copper-binding protein CopC
MRSSRLTRALAVAAVASGVAAAAAFAHTEVKSTYPAKGKTVSKRTSSASVTFTGTIRGGTITVKGPGGKTYSRGKGGRDPRNVRRIKVPLKTPLAAGRYTATWTMKAADGHTQRGKWTFRVK